MTEKLFRFNHFDHQSNCVCHCRICEHDIQIIQLKAEIDRLNTIVKKQGATIKKYDVIFEKLFKSTEPVTNKE